MLVKSGADPNDVYTDEKGKEHNLLFDSVTLGNEVRSSRIRCSDVSCAFLRGSEGGVGAVGGIGDVMAAIYLEASLLG